LLLFCRFVAGTGGNEAQAEFNKQRLADPCVCVTTFNMIAHGGKRSEYGKAVSAAAVVPLGWLRVCWLSSRPVPSDAFV
jgi:hypothetical protein